VETGDKLMTYRPVSDESKWALDMKRSARSLAELACDVDLAANQVLIVGCRSELDETIGFAGFVRLDGAEPMQGLLVIRHLRPSAVGPATASAATNAVSP